MVIYCLTNSLNGKKYIGQAKNLKIRLGEHRRNKKTESRYIYRAIKKYGWESFEHSIIATATTKQDLDVMERHYIKEYGTMKTGYNLTSGGEGGAEYSAESKRIISEKNQAWWDAHPEEKERMSKQHKGKKVSQETKDLMIKNMPQRKEVMIEGKNYISIREAARQLGISKQLCQYRLKSVGFPEWRVLQ